MYRYCCSAFVVAYLFVLTVLFFPLPTQAQIAVYMVGAMDKALYEGETARVVWLAPLGRTERAWVGLYAEGASDRRPLQWRYIHDADEYGYLRFPIEKAGNYEVRMFTGSYNRVAVAPSIIRVRPDIGPGAFREQYRLDVRDRSISLGDSVEVAWEIPWSRSSQRHWVGLFEKGASDNAVSVWSYTTPAGAMRGTTLLAPRDIGTYEVRLFVGNGYERVAESTTAISVHRAESGSARVTLRFDTTQVNSGDTVRLSWSSTSARGSRDWVGLYAVGASDRQYLTWKYVTNTREGSVTFVAPRAGMYEARFFSDNGYIKLGDSSNRLTVR